MTYLYRTHLGGFFTTDHELTKEETYCDICGDWDECLGWAEDISDLWGLMAPEVSIFGSGGVQLEHAYEVLTGKPPRQIYKDEPPTDLDVLAQIASYLGGQ